MAFDLLTGKQTPRDWSCGAADGPPAAPSTPSFTPASKLATGAVLAIGVALLLRESSQPVRGAIEVTRSSYGSR